jgi:hypothetical protein
VGCNCGGKSRSIQMTAAEADQLVAAGEDKSHVDGRYQVTLPDGGVRGFRFYVDALREKNRSGGTLKEVR